MIDWGGVRQTDWGEVYLERHRAEETFCECRFCEGHVEWILLPESEWYWRPTTIKVDMSDIKLLEPQPSLLFKAMQSLSKKDDAPEIDWMKDAD